MKITCFQQSIFKYNIKEKQKTLNLNKSTFDLVPCVQICIRITTAPIIRRDALLPIRNCSKTTLQSSLIKTSYATCTYIDKILRFNIKYHNKLSTSSSLYHD